MKGILRLEMKVKENCVDYKSLWHTVEIHCTVETRGSLFLIEVFWF